MVVGGRPKSQISISCTYMCKNSNLSYSTWNCPTNTRQAHRSFSAVIQSTEHLGGATSDLGIDYQPCTAAAPPA